MIQQCSQRQICHFGIYILNTLENPWITPSPTAPRGDGSGLEFRKKFYPLLFPNPRYY